MYIYLYLFITIRLLLHYYSIRFSMHCHIDIFCVRLYSIVKKHRNGYEILQCVCVCVCVLLQKLLSPTDRNSHREPQRKWIEVFTMIIIRLWIYLYTTRSKH